jgi:rfaE bifunctional protein kinase chain/domain
MNFENVFANKRIAVIGDVILDHYVYGKVNRVSPEAPVPVVLKEDEIYCLGGAANVAQNISVFGSLCYLISVCGEDEYSNILSVLLEQAGITPVLISDQRPTTVKTRIIGNGHQITRIDNETTSDISGDITLSILESFDSICQNIDGVILQDYGKGVLTRDLTSEIIKRCNNLKIPVLTDPKDRDFSKYYGTTILKPNLSEFKEGLKISQNENISVSGILDLSKDLIFKHDIEYILITLSENGMVLSSDSLNLSVAGHPINIVDVSGAGDTVSAVFMLMFLAGFSPYDCILVSNLSGSLVCRISGAVPVNPNDIYDYMREKMIQIPEKSYL